MTRDRSEVYLIQPYVIVCGDCWQVRSVHNTTVCDQVCDDWEEVKGVFNTTLCDKSL